MPYLGIFELEFGKNVAILHISTFQFFKMQYFVQNKKT